MPFCQVEKDVRVYYETFGSGDSVVFVHGGGMSHEFWEQQMYALADSYQVVALDLRGHGESDKPPYGHNFDRFTQDLEVLVEHLKLRRIAVVCHAVGGYVGMKYALRNPDNLSKLVLVSTGARFVGGDEERGGFSTEFWAKLRKGMEQSKIDANAELIDQMFFHKPPSEATRQALLTISLQWPLCAVKEMGRDAETINFEDRLHEIRVPVLVVHGRHDRKQRYAGGAYLAEKLPNGRLVTFEDSAHLVPLEEVHRFNQVLLDFLGESKPV
jgi:pimeloyl-ACP methyl ester carboxylesterase